MPDVLEREQAKAEYPLQAGKCLGRLAALGARDKVRRGSGGEGRWNFLSVASEMVTRTIFFRA